jgi:multidrug efflux pump subunit AcrA (membrane-fusion protein)
MFPSVLLFVLGCVGGGPDLPTAVVQEGPFDVTLSIPGELRAVKSVALSAPDLPGQAKITWVIEEGSKVEAGAELLRFDETELKTTLDQAKDDLEIALTKIDQQRAVLAVKLGDLENDVISATLALERAKLRITESETVPRVERETTLLDVKESTLAVERSRAGLESARLEGQAELELLRLDAERARRTLENVETLIAKATLTAPSPGIVVLPEVWKGGTRGPVTAGDSVYGGSALIELPDMSTMEVQAWVHEVDAAKVAVDQPVKVVIDAHPVPAHAGRISRVADLAVKKNRDKDVKYLKVSIVLDETTDKMKPGMTIRADVLVAHRDGVLSIPQEAVFYERETAFVYRKSFRGFTRTPVTLDLTNDTHAIVTSGLDAGDVVALVDPEKAGAGETPSPGRTAPPTAPAAAVKTP